MTGYLLEIGQALLALLLAPGLVGFIRMVKSRLQGRRGAPPWQPYYDLRKLFGKEAVVSRNASWLFRFAPYLIFATTMVVTMLVPLIAAPLPFDAVGDLLMVVYLMLLGTFFLALAGLDPGTAFGGMGASRQAGAARAGGGLDRDARRQAATVPRARAAGRFVRAGAALGHVFFFAEVKR